MTDMIINVLQITLSMYLVASVKIYLHTLISIKQGIKHNLM